MTEGDNVGTGVLDSSQNALISLLGVGKQLNHTESDGVDGAAAPK